MKTILILGAGFGGLRTALLLDKKLKHSNLTGKYEVVLVDKNDYHLYTPALYEVVVTPKETADYLMLERVVTIPVTQIIDGSSVIFWKGTIKNLDVENARVAFDTGEELPYEYVVIALGSEVNGFGIPGVKEYGHQFKTFLDAVRLRDKIFELIADKNYPVRIVVGGGGSTGVELAAELAKLAEKLAKEKKQHILSVSIIEGSGSVLSNFGRKIIQLATERLENLRVQIIAGESISSLIEKRIVLKSNKIIPFDLFIWTGGVKASGMLGSLPFKIERQGKVRVGKEMLCVPATEHLPLLGMVYGLGDSVCFYDPKTQKPIAGVARAAISQGTVVAQNIFENIKLSEGLTKKTVHKKYLPIEYPYIIPVGAKWAIIKIGPFVIKGIIGWVMKGLVELNYLASIMPIRKALSVWFAGLKIFMKNNRLNSS